LAIGGRHFQPGKMCNPADLVDREGHDAASDVHHLKRFAFDRFLNQPASDGAGRYADRLHRAVNFDFHALQIRLELALGDPGDLTPNAAEVFGLAAAAGLITAHRLFSRNGALHTHDRPTSAAEIAQLFHYRETLTFDKFTA